MVCQLKYFSRNVYFSEAASLGAERMWGKGLSGVLEVWSFVRVSYVGTVAYT
jgi:hypothetical protein